jgi:uncharacterized protein (DUF302 family)
MTSLLRPTILALVVAIWLSPASAAEGLIEVESPYSVPETMSRLEQLAEQRGLTIFSRIDHAAGAASVGASLRPTQLLIFGNPRGGTPFMSCAQTVGIDLPLKALVWEDASSRVWIGYNDIRFIAERHEAADCPVVENLRNALETLVAAAAEP